MRFGLQRLGKSLASKAITGGIIAAVAIFGAGTAQAASIKDIDKSSDYAKSAIAALAQSNIISGDQNSNFHPHDTLKRDELIKMVVNALGIDITKIPDIQTFKDVPKGSWEYPYVEAAYLNGIVKGVTADTFGAEDKCTREQMAAIFVRAVGLNDDNIKGKQDYYHVDKLNDKDNVSGWAKDYVEFVMTSGLMGGTGNGNFSAANYAQREQVAVLIQRFLNNKDNIQKIVKGYLGEVDYPELYNAIKNNDRTYKGGINADMQLTLNDLTGYNPPFSMHLKMDGTADGQNYDMTYSLSMDGYDGASVENQQFRIIKISDNNYVQQSGSNTWSIQPATELQKQLEEGNDNSSMVLKYYITSPVIKDGQVDINGVMATKYTIKLNQDSFNELINSSPVMMESGTEAENSIGDLTDSNGTVEYYLDSNNQIIKEAINYSGNISDLQNSLDASMNIVIDVNLDASKPVDIKAPDPTQVESQNNI
ncbi:MAG: S-layer homology domain-containing protein [Bacillota bacterium]|nr:S-layer homology domain-containing protein [Bacillota bacterium]